MKEKIQKPKRKFKPTVINLLGGKQRRIKKAEVVDIQEQFTLGGGAGHCALDEVRTAIHR